ncbi:Ig domain protein group 2 domain protein [Gemmatirosa kalamazoonensis]|uniref:Ig domain protein group 2 domain protein n=1 Tax=Gemmatirosa kalamazoonensis TaxID=861299 RepID=W0RMV3_9BACT|nr:Ig-like domain-containing protein [Gemmatirosa kalamazoonensis]AHG91802.1 Ig domain protein group 2 domain protein [Gemmatirosa kalamazoonensis]
MPARPSLGRTPSRAVSAVALTAALAVAAACADDPVSAGPRATPRRLLGDVPRPAIVVSPDTARVVIGRSRRLDAVVRDSAGTPVNAPALAWSSSDTTVARVDSAGVVSGVAVGLARITAARGADSASAIVTVHDASIWSVSVAPREITIVAGDTVPLAAVARDAQDAAVATDAVRWSASSPDVVDVDSVSGVVNARTAGAGWIIASVAGTRDSAAVTVVPGVAAVRVVTSLDTLEAYDVRDMHAVYVDSAGRVVTHGAAVEKRVLRWSSSDTTVARIDSVTGVLTGIDRGTVTITARSDTLVGTATRVVVIRYRSIVAGTEHACDIASGGIAWCWGLNAKDGRIGLPELGDDVKSAAPVRIPGGHRFTKLEAYGRVTCGLEADGKAWCWGNNGWGMLARPTGTYQSATPLLVSETMRFRALTVGDEHVCGIATDDRTYCWGYNGWGQMGTGRTGSFTTPTLAEGGMTLGSVSAGGSFVCGLTPKGEAYCSGYSGQGNLGEGGKISGGNTYLTSPQRVVGGLTFRDIHASNQYACALTPAGAAWCWGNNAGGTLGTTSVSQSSSPVAVDGGLTFRSIATGYGHACGVTTDDALYCWGSNKDGELGTAAAQSGTRAPIRAAGKLAVAEVSAANVATGGGAFTCTIAADRLTTLCWGRNDKGQLGNGTVTPLGPPNVTPSIVVGQKPE